MRHLILASQSPRRRELLEKAGFAFTVLSQEISEILNKNLSLEEQICDLARRKAEALIDTGKLPKGNGNLLLSADTVVVLDGEVLGKPSSLVESEQYIRRLSGQTHRVITAICFLDQDLGRVVSAADSTYVTFHHLSEEQIRRYVDSRDGMDKAGAYGVQGEGGKLVARVDGAFDNVMGLPVALVERLLQENAWHVERRA